MAVVYLAHSLLVAKYPGADKNINEILIPTGHRGLQLQSSEGWLVVEAPSGQKVFVG